MEFLPLTLILFVGLAAGFASLYWLLQRQAAGQAEATNGRAVEAAVRAALAERGATAEALGRDREATVNAAVLRAAEVADAKLDSRMRAGTEQLDARFRQGAEKLQANMLLGEQKYDASTSIIEKQNQQVRAEMLRIEKMLTDLQEKTAGQHGAVVTQLQETAKIAGQLQQTTGSLRDALGSTKKRGNWGERMAQDVLNHAGMIEGVNYRTQKGIESGGRPDFTILMPRQMVLHMDVKFPADNYLNFLDAEQTGAGDAEQFRKQFVKDARARVKELDNRRYHEEADSVDTVVLFIPNESVFGFVQENDPDLMDEAMRAKIVLCGPSTLVAVLQVVRQAMDNFMLEQRSDEIMDCLHDFKIEWLKFSDKVTQHGKHLNTALNSFSELSGARTNKLQKQLGRIDELQQAGTVEVDPAADEPELAAAWPPLREVASA
ncbi:MAG: DNA recombination protein RmuC [Verrucomicrobiales bacterium]|jgi:DNA recombination protein RmuC